MNCMSKQISVVDIVSRKPDYYMPICGARALAIEIDSHMATESLNFTVPDACTSKDEPH